MYYCRMRIALVTREFNGVMGGLERQLIAIAKILVNSGHDIIVVSLDVDHGDSFYSLSEFKIKFFGIGLTNPKLRANLRIRVSRQIELTRLLKKERIDYCFAFMIGSLYLARIPSLIARIPLVLCERNSPSMYNLISNRKFKSMRYLAMLSANSILVQFISYKKKYPRYLRRKIHVIPNSVPTFSHAEIKTPRKLRFTFAGRLSFQKQVLRLVNGFAIYCASGGTADLEIYGHGEQREQVLALITKKRLENRVSLNEPNPDITSVLSKSNLLCIFSLWEGFPNILAEALSMGIPGIGFRQCDGVNELLIDELNGVLVDDDGTDESIANGLLRCESLIIGGKINSDACRQSVAEYSEASVEKEWESFIRG